MNIYEEKDDFEDQKEVIKVVLIGETGVGKTSIISQFVNQIFQEDLQPSTGGTFNSKSFIFEDGKILKFNIWDTAGKEKYRALSKLFYKDANAAILVYDITNQNSFEELQNYWAKEIKETSISNVIIAIVANKSDLIEKEIVNEDDARKLAKELNGIFLQCSAKNSVGIDDIFIEITKKYTGREDFHILNEESEKNSEKDQKEETIISKSGTLRLSVDKTFTKNKKRKCC